MAYRTHGQRCVLKTSTERRNIGMKEMGLILILLYRLNRVELISVSIKPINLLALFY